MSLSLNFPGELQEQQGLSTERFGFTLFFSVCLHLVIILGVGFTIMDRINQSASLEITLAQYRSENAPEQADFLAQANQQGSGDAEEILAPSTDVQSPFSDDSAQDAVMPQQRQTTSSQVDNANDVLAVDDAQLLVNDDTEQTEDSDENLEDMTDEQLAESIASLQAQLDLHRQARANQPRRHIVTSASTREADDALYLDTWRKKIEAVGNLNYPQQASRQGVYGTLRLLVAVKPDGHVEEVRILRSSGSDLLDQAAMSIVNLAAPFQPFSEQMQQRYDILEIIRTWQFHQGDTVTTR